MQIGNSFALVSLACHLLVCSTESSDRHTLKGGALEGELYFWPAAEVGTPPAVNKHRKFGITDLAIQITGSRFKATVKSDPEARFAVTGLSAGTYRLELRRSSGQRFNTAFRLSKLGELKAVSLNLVQNPTTGKVTLRVDEIRLPYLRRELLAIYAEDQAIRQKWIAGDVQKDQAETLREMEAINLRHVRRLNNLVSKHGWLTPRLVGHDGSKSAFLVIQHAPPKTQIAWHPVLERAFQRGELPPDEFAMFTDRVLLAKGQKQRYGTVAFPPKEWKNGEPVLQPIEETADLDALRASVGLGPIKEYLELLRTMYRTAPVGQ